MMMRLLQQVLLVGVVLAVCVVSARAAGRHTFSMGYRPHTGQRRARRRLPSLRPTIRRLGDTPQDEDLELQGRFDELGYVGGYE
jgi:hypothetical protein